MSEPAEVTPRYLAGLGIHRISRGDAIRDYCVRICMCGSIKAVAKCASGDCPLWPFKMGTDPWREKREMTDEQRQAAVARLAGARRAAKEQTEALGND